MIFWIASYPKSGNTWLRALLSSYYYSDEGIFSQNLLENISQFPQKKYFKNFNYDQKIITDTSKFWIKSQEIINKDKKLKFFKTHNILGAINNHKFTDQKNSIGAIYVIRDPRNIISSLQNHYEINKDQALEFMLNDKKFIHDTESEDDYSDFQFISSWEKNYKSWNNQNIFPIKIVKYEDLNKKTYDILKDVITFIDKIKGDKNIFQEKKARNCVQSTTFDKMKEIEKNSGFVESILSKKKNSHIPFFHLGPNNNWKNLFDKDFKKKINISFKEGLKDLGYK